MVFRSRGRRGRLELTGAETVAPQAAGSRLRCIGARRHLIDATKAVDVLASGAREVGDLDLRRRDRPEAKAAVERIRDANIEWRNAAEHQGC